MYEYDTGIYHLDEHNRLTIPDSVMREFEWDSDTKLEIIFNDSLTSDSIIVKAIPSCCSLCQSKSHLLEEPIGNVCSRCAKTFKTLGHYFRALDEHMEAEA